MVHPKERVSGVHITMEADVSGLIEPFSAAWDLFVSTDFFVDLAGPTEGFLARLGSMGELGVPQEIISLMKYARGTGARWLKLLL